MKTYVIAIAVGCALFASCKKDPRNEITFGKKSRMTMVHYDSLIKNATLELDVNKDGQADFSLKAYTSTSPMFYGDLYVKLNCLNDKSFIAGELVSDTTFYHEVYNINGYDTTVHKIYSCYNQTGNDSITEIKTNQFHPKFRMNGEKLLVNDPYKTGDFILYDEYIKPYSYGSTLNVCHNIDSDKEQFIGIKYQDGNKVRLGWIRVQVINKKAVLVYDTALRI